MLLPAVACGVCGMMGRAIRLELKKALTGAAFKLAIAIAGAIVLYHLVIVYGMMQQLPLEATPGRFTGKYNLFYWWLAIDCVSAPYAVFYTLFPLLACMPYAWSFMAERKCRYIYQLYTRSGKAAYFISKFVAVFISGGLVIAIPLAIDLFGAAMFAPASLPSVTFSMPGFSKGGFLASVYYSHPWLFCMAFLIMDFLWTGAIASTSFIFALIYERGVCGVIMPALAIYIWDILSTLLKQLYTMKTGRYLELSVLRLLHACTNSPNPAWLQLSMIAAMLLLSGAAALALAARRDVL